MEAALAAMEAVGVSAALVDSNHVRERRDGSTETDNSYAREASLRYPGVFGPIAVFNVDAPNVDDLVAQARTDGFLGVRCFVRTKVEQASFDAGDYDRFFSAAQRVGMPVLCLMFRHLPAARATAAKYPSLRFIIDHMGLPQPPWQLDEPVFKELPLMTQLATHDNVAVRLCGVPSYSRLPYPHTDVWEAVTPLIEAFGPERLMWGSDLTRLFGLHTYADLLGYLLHSSEVSDSDKEQILGTSIRRILDWPAPTEVPAPSGWQFGADDSPPWLEN
jgi:predicted TIM-barrel fold metal-dependent hydrolase